MALYMIETEHYPPTSSSPVDSPYNSRSFKDRGKPLYRAGSDNNVLYFIQPTRQAHRGGRCAVVY